MQTTLFETPDTFASGASARPSNANLSARLRLEGASRRIGDRSRGVVVIHSSSSAAYGSQSSEFWIREGLVPISFADLVRESSGHLVLPIDPCSREDSLLLKDISQALDTFVRVSQQSGQRHIANRINDVGKRFEYSIAEAIRKTALEVSVLGRPGYPDCLVTQGERTTYLEIKTSATIQKPSNAWLKTFSFSSGKKIKYDARHLLLKLQLEEEDSKIWKVLSWELRDLSTLKVKLKTEFDAGFSELEQVPLLRSSKLSPQALFMTGQSLLDEPAAMVLRPSGRRRRPRPTYTAF